MYMVSGFTLEDTTCLVLYFAAWVLDSRFKTVLACLGCFAMAILHEALVAVRRRLVYKQRLARHSTITSTTAPQTLSSSDANLELQLQHQHQLIKSPTLALDVGVAVLYGGSIALGYLVMLAVMTYHPGLFVAAIAGFSSGQFFFKDAEAPLVLGDAVEVAADPCCSG